ncbi:MULTISPECIES: carbohydrate ABC transporter permease [unclassified Microbacterium]|uniref:carbohydrate ABC transporter permease n=1 Tax=unclassified Microbacterium TaxID=2609290 RepID=UPI0016054505|nr:MULTISPECIES: sugar ABC transporter permease [unclassified Microbacterium]QNA91629.1 sugar ABC transporter permease [Microbacterium sp. Se63.02b]QYM64808.1 sugar ABC transporter permease [Microbacterium sp. Se5.02b]
MSPTSSSTLAPDAPASSAPAPAPRGALPRRRPSVVRWYRRGGLVPVLFAVPGILAFAYFSWGPIVSGAIMGFQRTNLIDDATWVGLTNFTYVLSDPVLPQAVANTVYFAVLGMVFGFPAPLVLAVYMAELRRSRALFNTLAYLPVVIPPIVAILLWKYFYDPSPSGLFNEILGAVGLGPFPWLNSSATAMPSIVLEVIWATAGGTAIIYLAAITSVKPELYEAVEIDGGGIWRRIWHVTLPQLRGVILALVLLQLIGTLQVFTEPYVFTGGGPDNATVTVLMLIYSYAFQYGDYGAATALSFLLALALAVVSVCYLLATRKWSKS